VNLRRSPTSHVDLPGLSTYTQARRRVRASGKLKSFAESLTPVVQWLTRNVIWVILLGVVSGVLATWLCVAVWPFNTVNSPPLQDRPPTKAHPTEAPIIRLDNLAKHHS
jgi:hypothetical protein